VTKTNVGSTPYDRFARKFIEFLTKGQHSSVEPLSPVVLAISDQDWKEVGGSFTCGLPPEWVDAVSAAVYTPFSYPERLRRFIAGKTPPGSIGDRLADYNAVVLVRIRKPGQSKSPSPATDLQMGRYFAIAAACCVLVRLFNDRNRKPPDRQEIGIAFDFDEDALIQFPKFLTETTPEKFWADYGPGN
jgi:hypothetical protein